MKFYFKKEENYIETLFSPLFDVLHSSPMVYMNHTEPIFQDLLLYCTKKVPENHNHFFPLVTGVKHTTWCLLRLCFINLSLPSVYNTDRKRCIPHLCPSTRNIQMTPAPSRPHQTGDGRIWTQHHSTASRSRQSCLPGWYLASLE